MPSVSLLLRVLAAICFALDLFGVGTPIKLLSLGLLLFVLSFLP